MKLLAVPCNHPREENKNYPVFEVKTSHPERTGRLGTSPLTRIHQPSAVEARAVFVVVVEAN